MNTEARLSARAHSLAVWALMSAVLGVAAVRAGTLASLHATRRGRSLSTICRRIPGPALCRGAATVDGSSAMS